MTLSLPRRIQRALIFGWAAILFMDIVVCWSMALSSCSLSNPTMQATVVYTLSPTPTCTRTPADATPTIEPILTTHRVWVPPQAAGGTRFF